MRSSPADFELRAPTSLEETLRLLAHNVWTPFAGGTDLMVLFEAGKLPAGKFVSLWGLGELRGIHVDKNAITLGALTTYSELQRSSVMQKEFPILCQSAFETGAIAIQNRGTLGGNIANASPAADSSPGLLVYEAEIELVSLDGSRWVPYGEFHLGYKKTARHRHELIRAIRLPRRSGKARHYWRKVGTRKAQAISKVAFAAVEDKAGVRIALGSVGPTVIRCRKTEAAIAASSAKDRIPQARAALDHDIGPIDDIRSTAHYRRVVAGNLLEDFLK